MEIKGVKKSEVKSSVQIIKEIFYEVETGHIDEKRALSLIRPEFYRIIRLLKMF